MHAAKNMTTCTCACVDYCSSHNILVQMLLLHCTGYVLCKGYKSLGLPHADATKIKYFNRKGGGGGGGGFKYYIEDKLVTQLKLYLTAKTKF